MSPAAASSSSSQQPAASSSSQQQQPAAEGAALLGVVPTIQEVADDLGRYDGDDPGAMEYMMALEALDDRIAMGLATATEQDRASQRQAWKNRVGKALAKGAGAGHRFCKVRAAWKPSTILAANGQVVSDPDSLLQQQVDLWSVIWKERSPAWASE